MWRTDPDDPDRWRRQASECEAALQAALHGLPDEPPEGRAFTVGGTIFNLIESIEIARNNIELLEGTGSYYNAEWVRAKLASTEARLAALMREIETAPEGGERWRAMARVQGTRKLVRKWKEELAYVEMYWRVGDCLKAKDEAQAGALYDAWWKWYHRLDRKDFDGPALVDAETFDYARRNFPESYVRMFFATC